ncbi:UNVERIFIED_CONTAM: hypothetical protein K2H54_061719 [Gekko kuhli]
MADTDAEDTGKMPVAAGAFGPYRSRVHIKWNERRVGFQVMRHAKPAWMVELLEPIIWTVIWNRTLVPEPTMLTG